MKNSRNRFERFCLKNRDKGIPNLMFYVAIGTFMVTLFANLGFTQIYSLLCFDFTAITKGQIWRLVTYIFTLGYVDLSRSQTVVFDIFSTLILLYCFFGLGRAVESAMGTFKFNLYYISGILLMDIFGMVFGGMTWVNIDGKFIFLQSDFSRLFSGNMAFFLYLSLILCFSTLHPDAQFLLFYLIPIKAWIMALFYFIFLIYQIVSAIIQLRCYPQCLFPLVGLANYFLFLGKDVGNLIPYSWRRKRRSNPRTEYTARQPRTGSVPFTPPQQKKETPPPYTHRCTICGRTDLTDPDLEFRYCSRCNGYFCYCQDHISNHTHIE